MSSNQPAGIGPPRVRAPIAKARVKYEKKEFDGTEGLEGFGPIAESHPIVTGIVRRRIIPAVGIRPDDFEEAAAAPADMVAAPGTAAPRPITQGVMRRPIARPVDVQPATAASTELGDAARTELARSKVTVKPKDELYIPQNRMKFKPFIINSYIKYQLAKPSDVPDPDACAKAIADSKKQFKTFNYQSFVRDYMQRASPYRGVLVYHGLGSGKTCTSIAGMEALNQVDPTKPVFIMTPASLSPNYRGDMTKCGPVVFRHDNNWTWVSILSAGHPLETTVYEKIGLPREVIRKQKGAWVPDPTKPPNFESLSSDKQDAIKKQIESHMKAKFKFVHYNGLRMETVRDWACNQPTIFDGATIVIDEVHNLIRTINGSDLETMYVEESTDLATYMPKFCEVGRKYRVSYLLYRMLRQAVGCKIIALSATPIINFSQEVGILANMLAGDTRISTFEISGIDIARAERMRNTLKRHEEVDYYSVEANPSTSNTKIIITPVPSGYRKVIDVATGELKGYVYYHGLNANAAEVLRERKIEDWCERVKSTITSEAVMKQTFASVSRLPDTSDKFNDTFIDEMSFQIKPAMANELMGRLSGLISYYKGGRADLMARVTKDEVVDLDMSDLQLRKYTIVRKEEIDRELSKSGRGAPAAAGVTFDQVTKTVNSTFKIFSRAACNFVFPGDETRPRPSEFRDAKKQAALEFGKVSDDIADTGVEAIPAEEVAEEAVEEAGEEGNAVVPAKEVLTYQEALIDAVQRLKTAGLNVFSSENLPMHSPKFQAIIDRMAISRGPVLVYSNFKTLEGVGLFSLALEIQVGYKKLDIVSVGGTWRLTDETISGGPDVPRYIMYTGDEEREKRQMLLRIYNGQWDKLPKSLADEIKAVTGQTHNKEGKVAKVFMITQSGAEGISLSNVRQVHIMEPYWNYVRLDQVKGRAVRICSHMDLPPEERTVEIYTYISRFGASQIIDDTLKTSDSKLTTDQMVMGLLSAKKKLADSLMDAMKMAAVDCDLNKLENGTGACYTFKETAGKEFLFTPMLE